MYLTTAERKILNILNRIQNQLEMIQEQSLAESIEEISLRKTSKLLHIGADRIIRMVENGELKAIIQRNNDRVNYRFRISDIREYQRAKMNCGTKKPMIQSTDELIKEYFGKRELQ